MKKKKKNPGNDIMYVLVMVVALECGLTCISTRCLQGAFSKALCAHLHPTRSGGHFNLHFPGEETEMTKVK